jgi:hypothetical protein
MLKTAFLLLGGMACLGMFLWNLKTGSAAPVWRVRVERSVHPFGYWLCQGLTLGGSVLLLLAAAGAVFR